ncbi:3-oxoacyl-ACP reductase [Litchfieldia alkalitelluris]|uniref:3-oxoacyl-ACP reductase n=1 Tax=Litchfieldia alkalitelluris TaxID=304268 RepID=UPI000997A816|nr:3-oxoacyl-ACP reductase [Litchfieldia alkalitelluris]
MDTSLAGRVVLITGSSRGIGAAIAEAFAQQGAHLIINYVKSEQKANEFAQYLIEKYKIDVLAIKADITDEFSVKKMMEEIVDEFDTLDILVNNALHGYTFDPETRNKAWELNWEDYQHQLDGSLKGTYHVCKYAIPIMKSKGFGRIINMTTNLIYRPVVPYHDYNTAKGAVLTFSQNLASDLGPFGITVNCIAPGLVYPTDASRRTKEEIKESIRSETPLRRIARPEDISGSALFFASNWANFITGQTIIVDGGFTMK